MSETQKMAAKIVFYAERASKTAAEKTLDDYLAYNSVAMDCFQAVNYGISLGEKMLENKLLELPTSYRDIFETLSKNGLVDKETRNAFIRAIHLRNVIAHQYDDLKDDDVKEIVTLMPALKKFAEKHLK